MIDYENKGPHICPLDGEKLKLRDRVLTCPKCGYSKGLPKGLVLPLQDPLSSAVPDRKTVEQVS